MTFLLVGQVLNPVMAERKTRRNSPLSGFSILRIIGTRPTVAAFSKRTTLDILTRWFDLRESQLMSIDEITYKGDYIPDVEEFRSILNRSGLGERRPVSNDDALNNMLKHANLILTAWSGDRLIGISRSITDYSYCCYLSDLAVDREYQKRGIGQELINRTKDLLHEGCSIILLSAPAAVPFYERIELDRHPAAFVIPV
jgi:GNAT superfamily N-acetyltransferase